MSKNDKHLERYKDSARTQSKAPRAQESSDYTTHSVQKDIMIAMTAYVLLTIMITRTVRTLLQPNGETDTMNDRWESTNTTPQNHYMDYETKRPYGNGKKACDLTLYGITGQPIFRRIETPVSLGPDTEKGTIRMKRWNHPVQCCATHGSYIPQYNTVIEDNEETPWSVDIYQPIFLLGTWYKWHWHDSDHKGHHEFAESSYIHGIDDVNKPNCNFKELKHGCWRATGGMEGWHQEPDLLSIPYVHLALTLQSKISAQQPSQRDMARLETRKATLFVLRRQAQVPLQISAQHMDEKPSSPTELIDAYIRHTQLNLEGYYGYDKIIGHFNCDDMETAFRHPNTTYHVAVDTYGFPIRRLETVNIYPRFDYLTGIENTETGGRFYEWMDWPNREEGELMKKPVDYREFEEEDQDGFKPRDYEGRGDQRRGNIEMRDERRREEAEQARDAFGLPVYGMTKTHYEKHYLPTGRLVERQTPTSSDNEQEEADKTERNTTQSPTMGTRNRGRSRTPARRVHLITLMLTASPTAEALHQQVSGMSTGTEMMSTYVHTHGRSSLSQ